jgi:hypothetical protein
MAKKRRSIGYETKHCMWLMQWVAMQSHAYPDLQLLFHVTNEGKRSRAAAGIAKAMGLKKGVHDYFLPVPRMVPYPAPMRGFYLACGLWIEMKKPDEALTTEQKWWGERMREKRYVTKTCYSWPQARDVLMDYLGIKP